MTSNISIVWANWASSLGFSVLAMQFKLTRTFILPDRISASGGSNEQTCGQLKGLGAIRQLSFTDSSGCESQNHLAFRSLWVFCVADTPWPSAGLLRGSQTEASEITSFRVQSSGPLGSSF